MAGLMKIKIVEGFINGQQIPLKELGLVNVKIEKCFTMRQSNDWISEEWFVENGKLYYLSNVIPVGEKVDIWIEYEVS
ncbi:MAG: hypothetical protein ACOCQR_03530 [bacterium]